MNLQETLEAMLAKRRTLVGKLTPAEQSRLLHEGLGNLLEQSLYAQGMQPEEVKEQHGTLRSMAGIILYLLHPEDEESVEGTWLTVEELERRIAGLVPEGPFHVVAGLDPSGQPKGIPILPPLSAGARVRILDLDQVWTADGKGGWLKQHDVIGFEVRDGVVDRDTVVVRKGDGTYKRKPRPDRT